MLRTLLADGGVVALGCTDPFSARLAELAGAKALYLSGQVLEAVVLGAPDMGLATLTEVTDHVRRITNVVGVPLICDAEAGFVGGPVNVHRAVRELERTGVAAIHIEDQALPKKCPLLPGKKVVERGEGIARIETAVAARTDPDFMIIARTDADVISFDEVIERSNRYLQAGADVAMPIVTEVDGVPRTSLSPDDQMDVLARLAQRIDGPVMMAGSEAPIGYTASDLLNAGFAIVPFAGAAFQAAGNAMLEVYRELLSRGTSSAYFERNPPELTFGLGTMRLLDLDTYLEIEDRAAARASEMK